MVDDGEIVLAPPLGLTVPIVGLIEADVAFEDDHEIEELPPEVILEGVAVSEQVGKSTAKVLLTLITKTKVNRITRKENLNNLNIFSFI